MQKKRILIVVIVGFLIIAGAFTAIYYNDLKSKGVPGFFSELFRPKGERSLSATEVAIGDTNDSYAAYKDTIICAGKHGVYAMDLQGEKVWEDGSASFLNPFVKCIGDYILVSETGSKSETEPNVVLLYKKNALLWKLQIKEKIISADVSKQGYVAVTHHMENYNAAITVLKPEAGENQTPESLFVSKINSEIIVSAVFSKNSGQLMASGISMEGETITGALSFINMENGKSYASVKSETGVYPLGVFVDDETLIAANAKSLRKLRRAKSTDANADLDLELWKQNTDAIQIYAMDILNDQYIITAGGADSQGIFSGKPESRVTIMDLEGKALKNFTVTDTVKRIDTGAGLFAVSGSKHTVFYNAEGEKVYEYDTKAEIQKVMILDQDNFAVVTNKEITILKAVPLKENVS